ncbi:MAG: LysM peptidoglycan-binding domain-containing protein [Chloroflexi bacterium]|nr:LysM peptidoglycan-binding domain-containing protein [Chloroflexota bacterium]
MRRYTPYLTVFIVVLVFIAALLMALLPVGAQQTEPTPTPQVEGTEYVLQPGDTLDGVAQEFDVSYQLLLAVNGITNAQNVAAGTVLIIPDGAPGYGEFPPLDENGNVILEGVGGGGEEVYVLQPGDTLDGVAQQFNISYISLLRANGITNAQNVAAGTVLVIPSDAPPYGQVPPLEGSTVDSSGGQGGGVETTTYVVQEGDTYASIARQFGVPVLELLQANNVAAATTPPVPGTELVIPGGAASSDSGGSALSGNQYVLQPGDTLDGVAQQFNISYQVLLAVNGITDSQTVPAGTVLDIPQGAPAYGEFPPIDAQGNVILEGVGGGGEEIYIMQPGDTLDGVAQQFNVSYVSLLRANDIRDSRNIRAGTVIVIPAGAPPYGQVPANEGG